MSANLPEPNAVQRAIDALAEHYRARDRDDSRADRIAMQHAMLMMVLQRAGMNEEEMRLAQQRLRRLDRRYTHYYSRLYLKLIGEDRVVLTCFNLINACPHRAVLRSDLQVLPFVAHTAALKLLPQTWAKLLVKEARVAKIRHVADLRANPIAAAVMQIARRRMYFAALMYALAELPADTDTHALYAATRKYTGKRNTVENNHATYYILRIARRLGLVEVYGKGRGFKPAPVKINKDAVMRYLPVVQATKLARQRLQELEDEARRIAATLR